jgi:hypothetical protein
MYAIFASEYVYLGNFGSKPGAGGTSGMVLVGGGFGVKHEVTKFLDIFGEAKAMFEIFNHFGGISGTGYTGFVMPVVTMGVDFKI